MFDISGSTCDDKTNPHVVNAEPELMCFASLLKANLLFHTVHCVLVLEDTRQGSWRKENLSHDEE